MLVVPAAAMLAAGGLWRWVSPALNSWPDKFSYQAEVFSLDNFYDEEKAEFPGEKRSVTKFSYEVVGGNILVINL